MVPEGRTVCISDGSSLLILESPQLGILLSRPHEQGDIVAMWKLQLGSEHTLDAAFICWWVHTNLAVLRNGQH